MIPSPWRGWEYSDTILLFCGRHGELTINAAGSDPRTDAGLLESLRRTRGLEPSEVKAVTVGGMAGSAFTADVVDDVAFDDRSGMRADAGDRVRAIVVAHPERPVSLVLVARAEAFERVVAETDAIVRTFRF